MNRLIGLLVLLTISIAGFSQPGSLSGSAIKSKVQDTTTLTFPVGYGVIYWNNSTSKWMMCDAGGTNCREVGTGTGGGASQRYSFPPVIYTTNRTIDFSDTTKTVVMNATSGDIELHIPADATTDFSHGQFIPIIFFGNNDLTVISDGAAVVSSTSGTLVIPASSDTVYLSLQKINTNSWLLSAPSPPYIPTMQQVSEQGSTATITTPFNVTTSGGFNIQHSNGGTSGYVISNDVNTDLMWDNGTQSGRLLMDVNGNRFSGSSAFTFTPTATHAGFNFGSLAGNPSSPTNGQAWYNSLTNELIARINGANVALGAGGGGTTTNPVTFNNGGAGAASGTTFDGSVARTISYNTIGAQPTITFGTGVLTALGVNIGSAGAPVLFDGALGTPSSGTLTNATGLQPTTGIVGWPSNASGVLTNNGSGTLSWTNPSGTGDVVGPASATDGVPALFDGTTGKLIKNSTPTGTGNPVMQTSPALSGTPTAPTAAAQDSSLTISNTAWVQSNALSLGSSKFLPTRASYNAYPLISVGTGQAPIEILNLGNDLSNTEDRNFITNVIARRIGSLVLGGNIKFNEAANRFEYYMSTASSYGSDWVEIGREGINVMSVPQGTHPYQHPVGMQFSVRNDLRSTSSSYTYVNQFMSPAVAVYESTASGLAQWTDTGGTQPMFLAMSEEAKGSGGALGNYFQAESHGSSYGGFRFISSNGTHASPSNSSTAKKVGSVYSTPYGGAYRRTAEMSFTTRGTVSGSAVGQSIEFSTSPDTDANLTERFRITEDGLLTSKTAPARFENSSVSAIPSYSAFATFTVAPSTSTVGQVQQVSTSTGGLRVIGLGTTSTASTAIPMMLTGILGATAPTAPAIRLQSLKHNGTTSATDLSAGEVHTSWANNATEIAKLYAEGYLVSGRVNTGRLTLTTATTNTDASAPYIDPASNNMRLFARPGSSGSTFAFVTHTANFDATTTSSTTSFISLGGFTFNPSSGTNTFTGTLVSPTINTTGTYAGKFIGHDYNPTLTSTTGLDHVAAVYRSGRVGIGVAASPVSTFDVDGSIGVDITSTSTDITLDVTHHTVIVDASGASRTITLPTAASSARRVYVIKKSDSSINTVTIDGNGSETIDGATTNVISIQYAGKIIQSDGTNWYVVGSF